MERICAGDFHPQSELVLPEHPQTLPPFPVVDMHAHFGPLLLGERYEDTYDTRESCRVLRAMGIEKVLCLELVWGGEYDRLCRKLEASEGMILPLVRKAAGLILEDSDPDSQGVIAGISLDIPVLIAASHATAILKSGAVVTLDTADGSVTCN